MTAYTNGVAAGGITQPVAVTPVNNVGDASGDPQCVTPNCKRHLHGVTPTKSKIIKGLIALGVIAAVFKTVT